VNDVNPPDVWFDLTVVSDPAVRDALDHLLTEWRMHKRWSDLLPAHRDLHRAILRAYLETGKPPSQADMPAPALDDLSTRDLIVLDQGHIVGAYPFTSRTTRHRVDIAGRDHIPAMCAIDALGMGAMARRNAQVRSRCAHCDAPVEIDVTGAGLAIDRVHPQEARIWAGITPVAGCAATSQCQSMLLFCNSGHLEEWRKANAPDGRGYNLSPAQALQLGAAIFRPFLDRA
jgi:Alkylmercury lyase